MRVFVEKHRRLFREPPTERVETRLRIAMPAGEVEVRVTAPPDDLPWAWGEEEPFDGLRRLENEAVLEAFLEARRTSGASEEEVGHAGEVVDEALRFKASRGEPGDRWTADEVEEYLLRHYPTRGGAPDEDLERVPASLDAFLEWLGTLGKGGAVALRAARERLARCRERFLTDARDPRRFGPAKTLLRAMAREGVDPTDSRAVDAFMAEFNVRVEKDPSLMPLPGLLSPRQGLGLDARPAPARPARPVPLRQRQALPQVLHAPLTTAGRARYVPSAARERAAARAARARAAPDPASIASKGSARTTAASSHTPRIVHAPSRRRSTSRVRSAGVTSHAWATPAAA